MNAAPNPRPLNRVCILLRPCAAHAILARDEIITSLALREFINCNATEKLSYNNAVFIIYSTH